MNAPFGAEDEEQGDLAQFERELRRILERRLVESAQSPSEPTGDEARQLARMAAHMEASGLAGRPRPLPPRAHIREEARATPMVVASRGVRGPGDGVPAFAAPSMAARPKRSQRRALIGTYVTLAAVALGVALLRGAAPGPDRGTPPAFDLIARGPSTNGVAPQDEAYLGGRDAATGAGNIAFPGRVTWDLRGQDGLVQVAVFDLDRDSTEAVSKELVEGSEWTPRGPLPKRFRVVVDRPADDGVSREELHCEEYFLP